MNLSNNFVYVNLRVRALNFEAQEGHLKFLHGFLQHFFFGITVDLLLKSASLSFS